MIPPVFSSFYNNTYLKDVQAIYAKELPISSPDPITPPAILTPSPVLPPSLLFDPRYFFVPEELLPPKKQICSSSSSSTTLSNSSRNQTYKMYLKHHEKQVEDILNYLDELHLHRIERMEEERTNGNELKTELKRIRTQIIRLQKKRMPLKRTSTSETPAITLDAIWQLIVDFTAALEAQTPAMARNITASKPQTLEEATNIAHRLMDQIIKRNSVQETNDHKRKFDDRRNTTTNNNYPNNNNYSNNRDKDNSVTCHACGEKGHYKSQCSSKTDNGTSHVSKKSLCDESLIIPKKEIWLDDKLNYMEESVEIMDREIKQLRRRCIPIVKVRWNSEFTWEREDQIRAKYPHLFSNITQSLN
ncbi:putative reverse transcriptase domain-containing protein [Tanacetum coccineum]